MQIQLYAHPKRPPPHKQKQQTETKQTIMQKPRTHLMNSYPSHFGDGGATRQATTAKMSKEYMNCTRDWRQIHGASRLTHPTQI